MQRSLVPALVLMLALSGLACADPGRVWRQKGRTTLDLTGKPLLVLPVHARLPGDRARLDAALYAALSAALGTGAVSLQPAESGLEALGLGSFHAELARGLAWAAWHGGSFDGEFDEVPGKLHTLLAKAPALLNQEGLRPEYVVAAHVFRTGGFDDEVRYKAVGGVYDPDDRMIRAAVEIERHVPERHLAVAVAHLGRELVARLVGAKVPEEPDWDELDDRLEEGKPMPEPSAAPVQPEVTGTTEEAPAEPAATEPESEPEPESPAAPPTDLGTATESTATGVPGTTAESSATGVPGTAVEPSVSGVTGA